MCLSFIIIFSIPLLTTRSYVPDIQCISSQILVLVFWLCNAEHHIVCILTNIGIQKMYFYQMFILPSFLKKIVGSTSCFWFDIFLRVLKVGQQWNKVKAHYIYYTLICEIQFCLFEKEATVCSVCPVKNYHSYFVIISWFWRV